MVLLVLVVLIVLRYIYDVDIVGFFTTGWFRQVLDKIYKFGSEGWQKYGDMLIGIWNFILNFLKDLASKAK